MEVNKKFLDEGYYVDVFVVHGPRSWKIVLDKTPNFDIQKAVTLIEKLGYNVSEVNLLNQLCVNILFKKSGLHQPFYNLISVQKVRKENV